MTEEEKQIREIEKGLEKTLKEVGGMKDQLKDMFKVPEFKQMEQSISQN